MWATTSIEANHDIIVLPDETRVVSITPSGRSYWARTAKIATLNSSNKEISYFLKVSPQARDMLRYMMSPKVGILSLKQHQSCERTHSYIRDRYMSATMTLQWSRQNTKP